MSEKQLQCIDAHVLNEYFHNSDSFATRLDIEIVEAYDGYAVATMPLTPMHRNGMGNAHGGAIYSLVDMAFAAVAHTSGHFFVTAQASITYLEPGRIGPLRAEARKIRIGRTLGIYEVYVTDVDEVQVAIATITGYNTKVPIHSLMENHKECVDDEAS